MSWQKIIYSVLKICGAVRVIQGQKVLQDDNTLEGHGITDGSTVNIVIEPDKEINLQIKLGSKEITHKVKNSVRIISLKQQLIDGGIVGLPVDRFSLMISADQKEDILFPDESLPLHLCGVLDKTTINVIGGRVTVQLVNEKGSNWYKTFPKTMTVNQMKKIIRSVDSLHMPDVRLLVDIWLIVKRGEVYQEIEGEVPIGAILSDNDIIYFIGDSFFTKQMSMPVYEVAEAMGLNEVAEAVNQGINRGRETRQVYRNRGKQRGSYLGNTVWVDAVRWSGPYRDVSDCAGSNKGKEIGRVGFAQNDTVLSVKLRVQAQFGFPVSRVTIMYGGKSIEDHGICTSSGDIFVS